MMLSADGSIRYPFEPKKGENSVELTFTKRDDLNQIGEFYKAIQKGLTQLAEQNVITFQADEAHKQRQCKSRKKETDDVTELQDALDAIEFICIQGEGYELKEGVFGAIAKNVDGNDDIKDDLEAENAEKTHFIKFIECLTGRDLLSLELVKDTKEHVTYKFIYGEDANYKVDFDKEIYPVKNWEKAAPDDMFNVHYKEMLEELTKGLKAGGLGESVVMMRNLKGKFKECMDKGVYPNFEVKDFPLPPEVGQI